MIPGDPDEHYKPDLSIDPRNYYTLERLKARRVNDPPRYLFMFCEVHELFTLMHPKFKDFMQSPTGVVTTENPSANERNEHFVLVFDADCILNYGFLVYPFTYNTASTSEMAEWRIIDPKDVELDENPFAPVIHYTRPHALKNIPSACLAMVGVIDQNTVRPKRLLKEINEWVLNAGFKIEPFSWRHFWDWDKPILRDARRGGLAENPPARTVAPEFFWGKAGAGVLFHCVDDNTYLLVLRSAEVQQPGTLGIPGGACSGEGFYLPGEGVAIRPSDSWACAKREALEELQWFPSGDVKHDRAVVFQKVGFQYTTFIVDLTSKQKEEASSRIRLNWENDEFIWMTMEEMAAARESLHFGVQYVLENIRG